MRFLSVAMALGILASGCSTAVADDAEDAAELDGWSEPQGSVSVERLEAHGAGVTLRTRVSARFVRVTGGLDLPAAEQLLGSPLHVGAGLERGCGWVDPHRGAAAASTGGAVELVDVGEMVLHAGSVSMPLAARAFPDVGDVVSGVLYTSRDASSDLPPATSYLFETSGSSLVAGFRARVDAPDVLAEVTVAGQPLHALEAIDPHAALSLSWRPGGAGDRIVVDVFNPADPMGQVLRCGLDDSGAAVIAESMASFAGSEVEITIHRHRRAVLSALDTSLDGAAIDFDFAVAARAIVGASE